MSELENNDWTIFPNPSNSDATIKWNNNKVDEIFITDTNGKLISKKSVLDVNQFQVENLESGIYFVNLYIQNEQIASKKLIVL